MNLFWAQILLCFWKYSFQWVIRHSGRVQTFLDSVAEQLTGDNISGLFLTEAVCILKKAKHKVPVLPGLCNDDTHTQREVP